MSDATGSHPPDQPEDAGQPDDAVEPAESEWERKRRLAQVFGDVLPETTSDERDSGAEPSGGDDWLRAQVPPHHG